MNFNELCGQLGILDEQSASEQLHSLTSWIKEHCSRDLIFEGTDEQQLQQGRAFTEFFLSEVLPASPHNINIPNPRFNDLSVLTLAVRLGLDRLIEGMKPGKELLNTANHYGMTLLHSAATEGNFHTVHTLLQLGADPCLLNTQNQYPLFSALVIPVSHDIELINNKLKIFKLLKDQGISLDTQDASGNTVVQQMAIHNLESLAQETLDTNPELAYLQNNHSHYPIHTAILNGSVATAGLLLKVKDGATLADSNGWTALHYAARYSDNDLIQLCCDASSNIDLLDHAGNTPLALAAELGRKDTVRRFIELGAKPLD